MVCEEGVQPQALLEVLSRLVASDVPHELEISEDVDASLNKSLPVHTLELQVSVVVLEGEVQSLVEVDVGSLDSVHVLSVHYKLVLVKVLWEDFHYNYYTHGCSRASSAVSLVLGSVSNNFETRSKASGLILEGSLNLPLLIFLNNSLSLDPLKGKAPSWRV